MKNLSYFNHFHRYFAALSSGIFHFSLAITSQSFTQKLCADQLGIAIKELTGAKEVGENWLEVALARITEAANRDSFKPFNDVEKRLIGEALLDALRRLNKEEAAALDALDLKVLSSKTSSIQAGITSETIKFIQSEFSEKRLKVLAVAKNAEIYSAAIAYEIIGNLKWYREKEGPLVAQRDKVFRPYVRELLREAKGNFEQLTLLLDHDPYVCMLFYGFMVEIDPKLSLQLHGTIRDKIVSFLHQRTIDNEGARALIDFAALAGRDALVIQDAFEEIFRQWDLQRKLMHGYHAEPLALYVMAQTFPWIQPNEEFFKKFLRYLEPFEKADLRHASFDVFELAKPFVDRTKPMSKEAEEQAYQDVLLILEQLKGPNGDRYIKWAITDAMRENLEKLTSEQAVEVLTQLATVEPMRARAFIHDLRKRGSSKIQRLLDLVPVCRLTGVQKKYTFENAPR